MDWVIPVVAIYAAIVATISGAWTVYGIRRDRSSIKVQLKFGYVKHSQSGPWMKGSPILSSEETTEETRILIEAANTGRRPVTLSAGGLMFRGGQALSYMGEGLGKTFPKRLDEGQSFYTWSLLSSTKENLKSGRRTSPIWAYVESETGQVYKSKLPKSVLSSLLDP